MANLSTRWRDTHEIFDDWERNFDALVDIAAKTRDQWVLLRVRDHGAGVAPELLAKLTSPFLWSANAMLRCSWCTLVAA